MFSTIIEGKADLADILFLLAAIVFAVRVVIDFTREEAVDAALVPAGLVLISLAWLVL